MKIINQTIRALALFIMSAVVPAAFGAEAEITKVDAVPDGDTVRVNIELTSPVKPIVHVAGQMGLMVLDFPNVDLQTQSRRIMLNHAGVGEVHAAIHSAVPLDTWVVVRIDSARPYEMETAGNEVALRILPHPGRSNANSSSLTSTSSDSARVTDTAATAASGNAPMVVALPTSDPPDVEHVEAGSEIDVPPTESPTVRSRFKIKFVSGHQAYINGGANAGLRVGMDLDIEDASDTSGKAGNEDLPIGAARIVGVATTSAILEIGTASRELKVGDWADLVLHDADVARKNVLTASANTIRVAVRQVGEDSGPSMAPTARSFRASQAIDDDPRPRTAGRIGFDYSGISSGGSTPGTSAQLGISFQSDIHHILGTHWNLEGYWRGRINRHSQLQDDTIQDSLNKTYTMQLYYDNPNSRWAAGVGRLYLPWAVSLDTIDGGYVGRKFFRGNTTGLFAGSTPDQTSWHFRPDQRIAGAFTNVEGGDYERFHYSSTTGVGITSIKWKLDRPFIFFENEASYKGKLSAYHSLIVDSPQGVTTNGIRPGAGISHSYFTLHYQPKSFVSFDLYHNFFRDVPTAVTSIVGTGLVDKLLFQGVSAGTHIRPNRYFTLYTTLGISDKTGDAHRSLNQMFGATWDDILHTGIRADAHYSKFNSNFGNGHYDVLSLSRQVTNRMFWNVQVGRQDVASSHTSDLYSDFVDDSLDINLGRHSYLQTGYTYVEGETLNYKQWYMSWGYRFDEGKSNPQFVKTLAPAN